MIKFQKLFEWRWVDFEGNELDPPWVHSGKKEKKIDIQWAYREMRKELRILISEKENMFLYYDGRYVPMSERELTAIIKLGYLPADYRTPYHWQTILQEFKSNPPNVDELKFDADENRINFTNGILNLKTGELEEHTPDYLSTRQVPCEYKPDLTFDDAPVFKKYIDTLVNGDEETKRFLLEYIGATLSNVPGWRFKRCIILVGEGDTGKTKIRELVMALVGDANNIAIDVAQLQARFGVAQLYQKRLAGSGDMSFVHLDELNIIKSLTGGDSIFAEFKGKDGFSFRYDGFLWFNANRLPYFRGDRGDHVYNRFMIVRCPNIIPKAQQDGLLPEKLLAEREAIVSAAISYLRDAIARGYVFTESRAMYLEREQYVIENNSLLSFVKACCVFGEDMSGENWEFCGSKGMKQRKTRRSDFHKVYKKWCQLNNINPERLKDIPDQMKKHFGLELYKTGGAYVYDLVITVNALDELMSDDMYFDQSWRLKQ